MKITDRIALMAAAWEDAAWTAVPGAVLALVSAIFG